VMILNFVNEFKTTSTTTIRKSIITSNTTRTV